MAIANFLTNPTFWAVSFGALLVLLIAKHLRHRGQAQYWAVWREHGRARCAFFLDAHQAQMFAADRGGVVHDAQNRIHADVHQQSMPSDPWPNASEVFSDNLGSAWPDAAGTNLRDVQAV